MLSVEEALEHVLAVAHPLDARRVAAHEAMGLVLAEEIVSDVDSPPHDKSVVDGYAIITADLVRGPAELDVLEEVTAGEVPRAVVRPGTAVRIMTGAPLPPGADAVVMVEQSTLVDERQENGRIGRVRLEPAKLTTGQNIMRRAVSMARGDRVLSAGHLLRPIELGVLAEVGYSSVSVVPRPRVAVLATGNELVTADQLPAPGQIRNSNSPMLVAAAQASGAESLDLGIARDEVDDLRARMTRGLEADILVLSGGVSAGVLDLVPSVLESLDVQPVFHKIRMKPGKPLWFGVRRRSDGSAGTLVFGLPGNPVSSLVGFELFVRPAIAALAGRTEQVFEHEAELTAEYAHRGDRPTYHPAVLTTAGGRSQITPLRWAGSGDLRALTAANALACFPAGDYALTAGAAVRARPLA